MNDALLKLEDEVIKTAERHGWVVRAMNDGERWIAEHDDVGWFAIGTRAGVVEHLANWLLGNYDGDAP